MEEYIVSALKYRPLTFDSVIGQQSLTITLKNAIASGKLAHAYLFCGPRGVGKTTCARIFAKAINCLNPHDGGDACGQCESCVAFDQQRSMNIHELDAASNNSVEDIRELCKQVLIPPQIGRYKVFIIDEVHMLSSAAFNAFLKTLEEPPSYVIFILATTEKHKILPTILSRCQVYDFQRMTTQNTIDHLLYVANKEGYTAEPEALSLIAEKADGGMRDALSIFDQMVSFSGGNLTYESVCQNLNVLSTEYYFQLVDFILNGNIQESLLLLNTVLQKGFDGGNFVTGLSSHLRNLLVAQDTITLPLLEMSEKMRQRYQQQASRCKVHFLYRAIKICNDCDQSYRTSRNKRLQVELCLIQCAQVASDSPDASGLGPAKQLQPIFSASNTSQAASLPSSNIIHAEQNSSQHVDKSATRPIDPPVSIAQSTKSSQTQQVQRSSLPDEIQNYQIVSNQEKSPSTSVAGSLRKVTFKRFGRMEEEQINSSQSDDPQNQMSTPVTESSLVAAWHDFINSLPRESQALAQRLRGLKPVVTGESTAEVKVSNPQMQQTIEEMIPQMIPLMRQHLDNHDFILKTVMEEAQELEKSFSPSEILARLQKETPCITDLIKKLNLIYD